MDRMRIHPAQHDEVGRQLEHDVGQAGVVVRRVSPGAKRTPRATAAMPAARRVHQGARRRPVGDDADDLGGDRRRRRRRRGSPAGSSRRRTPAPRDASSERRPSRPRVAQVDLAAAGDELTDHPRRLGVPAAAPRRRRSGAQITTMPMPMFSVRYSSCSSRPVATSRDEAEQRRDRPRAETHDGVARVGEHARQVLRQAATGDVGQRLDRCRRCSTPSSTGR